MEKSWLGPCATREAGSPETGGVPMHWEAPLQVGPRGKTVESWKTKQSRALEGRKQRKAALFSP